MSSATQQQNVIWIAPAGLARQRRHILRRAVAVLARLPGELRSWYRGRQALHDLRRADPRILRDIGLEQADLWQAVRHGRIDRGGTARGSYRAGTSTIRPVPRPSDWC